MFKRLFCPYTLHWLASTREGLSSSFHFRPLDRRRTAAAAQLICRSDLTGGGVAPPPAFGSGEGEAAMACVYIPVQNSEEEVRVQLDQLPRDASDILDILKAEQAPLDLWLIIAVRFFVSDFAFRICQFL